MIKPHASNRKRQYWFDMSRKYEASGLSKKVFCEKEGISENTLNYWRVMFKREIEGKPYVRRGGKKPAKETKSLNNLVPIVVTDQPESDRVIEIRTSHGHAVLIPMSAGPAVIQEIFKALGKL